MSEWSIGARDIKNDDLVRAHLVDPLVQRVGGHRGRVVCTQHVFSQTLPKFASIWPAALAAGMFKLSAQGQKLPHWPAGVHSGWSQVSDTVSCSAGRNRWPYSGRCDGQWRRKEGESLAGFSPLRQ